MSARPARGALAIRPGLLPAAIGTRVARLRLVAPARTRTRRTPFVIIVVAVLSLGLVGLIVVSTALQDQAFELADLRQEAAALKLQQQKAQHEVDFLESPASVARKAIDLSMVPNRNPVFLRLSDGSVVGRPAPAAPRTNVKRIDP